MTLACLPERLLAGYGTGSNHNPAAGGAGEPGPTPPGVDIRRKEPYAKKTVILGILIAGALMLGLARTVPAQDRMFTYDYSFKPGSEPDGFRGIKWQTDVAALDPLHTMEPIEILGPFVYYKKNKKTCALVTAKLDDIIYEFWNGKFSGVMIRVRGDNQFQVLKDYVFARFGPGQRSKVLAQMECPGFLL